MHSRRYQESRGRDNSDNDASFDMSINTNSRQVGLGLGIEQGGSKLRQLPYNCHARIDVNKENLSAKCQELSIEIAADPNNEKRNACGSYRIGGNQVNDRKSQSGSYGNGASSSTYGASSYGNDRNASSGNRGRQSGYAGSSFRDGGNSYSNDWNSYRNGSNGYGNRGHQSNESINQPEKAKDFPLLINWEEVSKKSKEAAILKWANCPHLTKDFYREKPEVAGKSAVEVQRMREQNNNTMASLLFDVDRRSNAIDIPNPVWKFEQCFDAYPDLLAEIKEQGFRKPSPIQCQAWPILLKGHDMIGISQKRSGKTLAILLPAIIHSGQRTEPNVLIIAPTRKLALELEAEVKKFTFGGVKATIVDGGGSGKLPIKLKEPRANIIICMPYQLKELLKAKVFNVRSISFLILDGVDRMLGTGFEPYIRKIMLDMCPDHQTVMTSAIWSTRVRRFAQTSMKNAIQVHIGSIDLTTRRVRQDIEILSNDNQKLKCVLSFIRRMQSDDKTIIFCGRKGRADDLRNDLALEGFKAACIYGDRDQHDKEQYISDIKSINIVVATDNASRSYNIQNITHVINYDMPRSIEEYVYMVGRTGRTGRTGTAITYLTGEDWKIASKLIEILEKTKQLVPDELRTMVERETC